MCDEREPMRLWLEEEDSADDGSRRMETAAMKRRCNEFMMEKRSQVLKKNDAGEHFPLLAICLGFELVTMIVSKNNNILEAFSASDQASTLQFMYNINIEETLFQRFPSELVAKLSTECLVMQNHKYGVSPETFQKTKELCSFFKVLTTSTDENNKVYVSTAQSKRYPVTLVQWHPEVLYKK
ncbi:gamma-glutamyl hydrolase 2-like protein [Tanacetum coccineum]